VLYQLSYVPGGCRERGRKVLPAPASVGYRVYRARDRGGFTLESLSIREDGFRAELAVLRRAQPDDRSAVVHTIVRVFAEDPVVRRFFPDERAYERRASAFSPTCSTSACATARRVLEHAGLRAPS
jgi:hypothetical protein